MVRFGLDSFLDEVPARLRGKRCGVLCHAASITSEYIHVLEALHRSGQCIVGAIFGPQHGLFGQTQDNMVEWEGAEADDRYRCPVFSLYGENRKPTPDMLAACDALIIDLQDVGARPYTYLWTLKLCMEACAEAGMPLYVLDRPNPIACIGFDGPMLHDDWFSFVGGAEIPLCHRMTIGEIALLLQQEYYPSADCTVIWMDGWWRDSLWTETGLPWVLPSPNMPTLDTAVVYPGMVMLEATNLSEGRGTTRPFELSGAPYLTKEFFKRCVDADLPGCFFREHGFIPTFQKWQGTFCYGLQLHVTDPRTFKPVATVAALLKAAREVGGDRFAFKPPPYEYETVRMPFDILAGSDLFRRQLQEGTAVEQMCAQWYAGYDRFRERFTAVAHYPETLP